MFGRKKKKKPKPVEPDYSKKPVLPNKLAEFVQAKYGLTPDELHKLFASVARVDETILVARRRKVSGKAYSRRVGELMEVADAAEYEKERADQRLEKNEKISELLEEVDFDALMVRLEVNDSIYPQRLAPVDIAISIDSAGDKLDELDRLRASPRKIYSPREETLLDVITLIKKEEPLRVARRIADRQRAYILGHSMEFLEAEYAEWLRELRGDPTPEELMARLAAEEEERLEEERLAAEAALRNFDDLPELHTLLDDVATLIRDNPEAAAAIVRQWIGNAVLLDPKT